MNDKYLIWYYDTTNKAGFADVYVWNCRTEEAHMFEARDSNHVHHTYKYKSCIEFIKGEFDLLDICHSYGDLKDRYPRHWHGIEKTKNRK